MRKSSLYITLGLLVAIIAGLHSCNKINGINNNQVVETPFSLYFTDIGGVLYNSNDGKTVTKLPFQSDGYPCRALCISGQHNLFMAKEKLYISTSNGKNFNHAYDSLRMKPDTTCSGFPMDLNQTMIVDIPAWNRIFCVSGEPDPTDNFLGIRLSLSNGVRGSWWNDLPDSLGTIGGYGATTLIKMTSFTLMPNGVLAGYDAYHNRNFYRTEHSLWNEVTGNPNSFDQPLIGSPADYSGAALPHRNMYPASGAPITDIEDTTSWYFYGHYNNQLIAVANDKKNCNNIGAYFSNDTGKNWTPFVGLPQVPLLCISAPFEEICLIGTHGAGLYILNTNTNVWQPNNNGLAGNISVRNIAFKQNLYKNGRIQKYIYLATDKGIYQSTDGGYNWAKTFDGNFVAIY